MCIFQESEITSDDNLCNVLHNSILVIRGEVVVTRDGCDGGHAVIVVHTALSVGRSTFIRGFYLHKRKSLE